MILLVGLTKNQSEIVFKQTRLNISGLIETQF